MTPSKESLQAAENVSLWYGWPASAVTGDARLHLATLIDTALAEHRERVKRLVEAAECAGGVLVHHIVDCDDWNELRKAIGLVDAALAALKEPSHDPVA
jgi:hypothetical protein